MTTLKHVHIFCSFAMGVSWTGLYWAWGYSVPCVLGVPRPSTSLFTEVLPTTSFYTILPKEPISG